MQEVLITKGIHENNSVGPAQKVVHSMNTKNWNIIRFLYISVFIKEGEVMK